MNKLQEKMKSGRAAVVERRALQHTEPAGSADKSSLLKPAGVSHGAHGVTLSAKNEMLQHEVKVLKERTAKTDELEQEVIEKSAKNQKLLSEVIQLRSGKPVVKLDATKVRPSQWANRSEDSFKTLEFENLKKEIKSAGGNVQPIKVRPMKGRVDEFEIIFGHRRHRACLEHELAVLALIEEASDAELFTQMDRENRQRADLRPYEQGVMYARALGEGLFLTLSDMAAAIGVDTGNASKAISLTKLPHDVLKAFSSPNDIQFGFATVLKKALKKDPELVIARAKTMQSTDPRPEPKVILEFLKNGGALNNTTLPQKIDIKGSSGRSGSIQLDLERGHAVVNLKNISPEKLTQLKKLIQTFLA